jgi:hypothetical protein
VEGIECGRAIYYFVPSKLVKIERGRDEKDTIEGGHGCEEVWADIAVEK